MPPDPKMTQAHGDLVAYLLGQAAQVQRQDPATFLWQVRRTLEALVRLIHLHHVGPIQDERPALDGLITSLQQKKVSKNLREYLDWLRTSTNHGVHIREVPMQDLRPRVTNAQSALGNLIDEAMLDPALLNLPEATRKAIQDNVTLIKDGGEPPNRVERALHRTEGELALAQQDRARLRQRVAELEASLLELPPPPHQASTWAKLGLTGAGAGLVGLVSGAALTGLVVLGLQITPIAQLPTPTPTLAIKSVPNAAPRLPQEGTPDLPPAPPAEAAGSADCPAGTVHIPATPLALGQPERPTWPAPLGPLTIEEEPTFCIDARPVRQRSAPNQAGGPGAPACDPGPSGPDSPARCVNLEEARAYCQARGAALPTLRQWEAFARSPYAAGDRELANLTGLVREWSSEVFPPAALRRRPTPCTEPYCANGMFRQYLPEKKAPHPEGNVLYSWNQQEPGNRHANLGFRCAWPADPGSVLRP